MRNALDARAAAEGRSAFSKPGGGTRVGEKIIDARLTLVSDPAAPAVLDRPFDNSGLPLARREWVSNGVLKDLVHSRFWAAQQRVPPTGAATSLMLLGGDQSLEDIIASTERAILVTRFWYIRGVNPRTLLFTGLTRDGTFLVENGKITRAVQNMRFNESPLFMLDKVDAVGRPVRLSGESGGLVMPALRVRDFHFTSLSDAV
jgi:predicted Zn-dependent protease